MTENFNRKRVLTFLDMFYSGDIEGALACCGDEIELIAPAPIDVLPHMGRHRGKDEVRQMWHTVHGRYSSKRHNGRIVQFDMAAFFTLRDGRIVNIREILDTFDLIQQVLERDLLAGQPPDVT